MSEYQYYEFLAVDRPLDERQRTELRTLSARAQITATGFVDEYHRGAFRGDPAALMERYFDACLHFANSGTRRLMFRFPCGLPDPAVAERYCSADRRDAAALWTAGGRLILSLLADDEPGGYWEEGEDRLASISPVRSEVAAGDLRLFYLAWLLSVQVGTVGDDELEPPVPPNLRTLSAPLRAVADFLRLDEDLLAVAASASPQIGRDQATRIELAGWVGCLPAEEKDELLVRATQGEGLLVQAVLRRRFRTERSPAGEAADEGGRTAGELWKAAVARRAAPRRRDLVVRVDPTYKITAERTGLRAGRGEQGELA